MGDIHDVIKNQPICMLSINPKVFEKHILNIIAIHINNIIILNQHGFMPGISTLTNLYLYEKII